MTTRLGLGGFSRSPYGSFLGKPQETTIVVNNITRLGLSGVTRSRYGSFVGKSSAISLSVLDFGRGMSRGMSRGLNR